MTRDMTRGSAVRHLAAFSVPLVLGNLLQLAYNAVDSIIVGRFAGQNALAAVGTANPVMNLLILGVSGLCIGASSLMSAAFGANDGARLRRCFSSLLYLGLGFSLLVPSVGFVSAGALLRALDVPAAIHAEALAYLRIILLGLPFTFLYNACAAGLRSLGDARTPVLVLGASCLVNTLLDVVFVALLRAGAAGAGYATLLAQAFCALACAALVWRAGSPLRPTRQELRPDGALIRLTFAQGGVTALQQACQPVGKLLIQRCINGLGITAIAVFNAVGRVDDFAFTPEQSISSAMMTFVAQNRGAKRPDRMRQGLSRGLLVETCYWAALFCVLVPLRAPVMRLFLGADAAAVETGADYLLLMAFFYLFPAFTNGLQGFFRGLGDMKITLLGTLTQISVRVACIYLLTPRMGLAGAAWACAAGWTCMLALEVPLLFGRLKRLRG